MEGFKKLIILVGEGGSGKTSVRTYLEKAGFKPVVTYTTRPIRDGEIDGVDYHFIGVEEFHKLKESGFFAETSSYREWRYGTSKESLQKAVESKNNNVVILTPKGLRSVQKLGIPNMPFYLTADRNTLLINMLERGDNPDEAYRRNLADVGMFDGVGEEVYATIRNNKCTKPINFIGNLIVDTVKDDERARKEN